jgi:photosystem II stability/assembly factor-like uncharacterized protein
VHGGLARSSDDGMTWALLGSFGPTASDVVIDPSGVITAARFTLAPEAATNRGIYQSMDHGNSFNKLVNGLPADWTVTGPIALALAASNAQVIYASISANTGGHIGLYRTADGGATWAKTAFVASGTQWTYDNLVAIDPTDAATVYIGGVGLKKSIDSGATWSSFLPVGQDQHAAAMRAADPATIVVGNDTGVDLLVDGGASGLARNGTPPSALAITQGYGGDVDPTGVVYLATQDNGVNKTAGPLAWTHLLSGDAGRTLVDYNPPTTVYEANDGYVERSDDSGTTWNLKIPAITPYEASVYLSPLIMDSNTPTTLYLGLMNLYKTVDRGDHWTAISATPITGTTLSAVAATGNDLYVGDQFGAIAASANGGATWQGPYGTAAGLPQGYNFSNGRYVTAMAVDPGTPSIAYASYAGFDAAIVSSGAAVAGHLFRTVDHGVSWSDVTGTLGDVPANWVTVDRAHPNIIYVATNEGVFESIDRGDHWTAIQAGLPNVQVVQVFLNRAGDAIYAVTHGRSVYRASRIVR